MSSTVSAPSWSLKLLGDVVLTGAGRSIRAERKTAGLLAYLALSGPTSRQRIAGLLWPDVDETRARNSLAQLLLRLRRGTYPDLVTGTAVVALDETVTTDVGALALLGFGGAQSHLPAAFEDLLANHEFDDCDEFAEWLAAARDNLRRQYAAGVHERIAELERRGDLPAAQRLAERLITLEPLSEAPYRLAMRLYAAAGDRAAALTTYARCTHVLAHELGIEPDTETSALAHAIESERRPTPPQQRPAQPASTPAVLDRVGRETEWERLEHAWASGVPIYLSGPAGIGKSRLALDFAASRGPHALVAARPGDETLPLQTLARAYRDLLSTHPDLPLEPWVAREIARLVPGLAEAPPPMTGAEDRLRFEEAVYHLHRAALDRVAAFVFDDLQFSDQLSLETWQRASDRLASEGRSAATLFCLRGAEVPESFLARVDELDRRGDAYHLPLRPLDQDATARLAQAVVGPGRAMGATLGATLQRYTGGNPLFVIEVARRLAAQPGGADELPRGLPPPSNVRQVVRHRLANLSPAARRAAQAAAVLQSDFDPELVGALLETPVTTLMDAWDELERADVLHADRFGHDVVYEVVLGDTARPVKTLLHRRAAQALERAGASAARVAQHWLDGGRQHEALPHLMRAGRDAEGRYQLLEARSYYGRAASIAELLGDADATFAAVANELELMLRDDTGPRPTELLDRLATSVRTTDQDVTWCLLAATHHNTRGEPARAERHARRGLAALPPDVEHHLRPRLLDALATALSEQNRYPEALAVLADVTALRARDGDRRAMADAHLATGAVLNRAGRDAEALAHQRDARGVYESLADRHATAVTDMHLGVSLEALADYDGAERAYLSAETLLGAIPGTARYRYNNAINLGYLYWGTERYGDALRFLSDAETHEAATNHSRAIVARIKALVYRDLGDHAAFESEIAEAMNRPDRTDPWRSHARIVWADELARRGLLGEARDLFDELERSLSDTAPPLLRVQLHLARAARFTPPERLEQAAAAERLAVEHDLKVAAHVALRRSQALLAAGEAAGALAHAERALTLHAEQPLLGPRAELRYARYHALVALDSRDARAALESARQHVKRVADEHVPAVYRTRYLRRQELNERQPG